MSRRQMIKVFEEIVSLVHDAVRSWDRVSSDFERIWAEERFRFYPKNSKDVVVIHYQPEGGEA